MATSNSYNGLPLPVRRLQSPTGHKGTIGRLQPDGCSSAIRLVREASSTVMSPNVFYVLLPSWLASGIAKAVGCLSSWAISEWTRVELLSRRLIPGPMLCIKSSLTISVWNPWTSPSISSSAQVTWQEKRILLLSISLIIAVFSAGICWPWVTLEGAQRSAELLLSLGNVNPSTPIRWQL